jgi:hypothetical protein
MLSTRYLDEQIKDGDRCETTGIQLSRMHCIHCKFAVGSLQFVMLLLPFSETIVKLGFSLRSCL